MARLADALSAPNRPVVGVELYRPSTTAGEHEVIRTIDALRDLDLTFASVGDRGEDALEGQAQDFVIGLNSQESYPVVAHLTCAGNTRAGLEALLDHYDRSGVHNVLALGGDADPSGGSTGGELSHAAELVELVRSRGPHFTVGVAAHPELHPQSRSRAHDRSRLADKLRMADFGISQFFFDAKHYFALMDDLQRLGIDVPVVPGVLPMWEPAAVRRMAAAAGVTFPEDLAARVEYADPMNRQKVVIEATADLCHRLLEWGAPGFHLYGRNRADVLKPLVAELGLR